jgi:outer membrane protein assembly factor BamD (BamD/ComL family)
MAKKLSKEELEQDPLVSSFERFQIYYEQNKGQLWGYGIALVLIIGLGLGYFFYSQSQENEAQQLMVDAEEYYMQGDYELALTGSEEDMTYGFEQIINNYSRTDAANMARYYAAVSEYRLGNPEAALDYLDDFEAPEGILGVAPISFRGVLLADLERYEEAAEEFVRAAEWDENESTTPYNLLEAAYAYLEASNRERAEELVDEILNDYSGSEQVTEAERLKGRLLVTAD